ncbi:MAG: DUF11 domain-containing protein [Caldilineae bacterium]|nr:DUF11 domain-containing protein [Caldilineae bacterium]
MQLLTDLYDTTRLADIDGIGYSTYRDPASTGFVAGVSSINLRIDLDGGGTSDAYMVYEPYVDQGNAAVLTDVWQTWDAYAGGAAKWWINTGAGGCGQGSPCSWSAILALFPNATIREAPACGPGNVTVPCPGSAGVNQGSFNLGFLSNVDGFYLSVLGERTTFDFQPNPRSDLSIFIQALKGGGGGNGGGLVADAAAPVGADQSDPPPNTVWAGNEVVYRVGVYNSGPDTAINATATITLPVGVAYLADTDSCTPAGGGAAPTILTCDLGDIERFEFVEFLIKTRVDPGLVRAEPTGTTVITAEASVTSLSIDANLTNNFDEDSCFVQDLADLKITKIVEPHTGVQAGEQFTYTILVDNLGPSSSRNIVVTDTLVTSGFVRANGCSVSIRTEAGLIDEFNCNFGLATGVFDLSTMGANWLNPRSPSDMGRMIITINLTANEGLDLTNTTTVTADTPDPDLSNNMAMVPLSVFDTVDLAVTKTALGEVQVAGQAGRIFDIGNPGAFPAAANYATSPTKATAGRRIRYTIGVTNDGPSTAENVVLTDRLPAGVTIVPGSLSIDQGSCETGTPGDPLDRLVCGLGTIPSGDGEGEPIVLTFDVLVDPSLDPGTVLENDVNVYSEQFDPSNADNHAFVQTIVDAWADMSITKLSVGQVKTGWDATLRREILQDLPGQVTAGHPLRYEITVQNNGASDARNVQVLDLLPGQTDSGLDHDPLTFIRAVGAECRADQQLQELGVFNPAGGKFGQVLWCDLGTVPAGARVTFDIYVSVDPAVPDKTTLVNGAFVWWGPSSPPAQPGAFLPFPFPQIPPILPTTDDPFLNNNFSSASTSVTAVADVYIQKVDVPASPALDRPQEPDHAIAGEEHRYRIDFGNLGWSVARNIAIQDFLDFKQFGILGERFLRCEPIDPDDTVSCSVAGGTVTVNSMFVQNDAIIPGNLNPGDAFGFYLITEVDPGYVLDGTDLLATNRAQITTTTTDFHPQNNTDSHDTEIIAVADLSIEKTDIFGNPLTDPDNAFLMCDPVQPGGMITYDLTVTNDGPSDAADVYVVDQLPADYVVVDPAQVVVTVDDGEVSVGQVVEVRDDGRITVRLGNDRNNAGQPELGRLNAGSTVRITIAVMVRRDAQCGGSAVNHAYVEARANAADWPDAPDLLPGIGGGPRTPTFDPDETNNRALETTRIECPKIAVNKTVSFNGQCPGSNVTRINEPGQPVTFCYEITNTGTTYLDTIVVTDTLTTKTQMMTVVFTDTITSGADPKVPVAPGETVLRQVTVPHFTKECGIATDTVVVTATPVNSGRTIYPCLAPVAAQDTAVVEVPCAGLDWRVALPYLGGEDCEAWLQVQNVGDYDTKALLVVWGDPGFCPPQAAGPLKVECTGLLRPGSAWSFAMGQLPTGARSAIAYSMNASDLIKSPRGNDRPFADVACDALFQEIVGSHTLWAEFDLAYRLQQTYYGDWDQSGLHQTVLDFGAHQGEPLVVSVNRSCPDAGDPNAKSNAAYSGLSRDMLGVRDPATGAYMSYAPLIFASNAGLNTTLWLQNAGDECTSLEIWLKGQDNCLRPIIGDILTLSPGESYGFDPNTVVGPDWLGSAWIRATQPMALVVDTVGTNHFTSYVGVAADNDPLGYSYGNQVSFAPLIYSEYQGWDTAIQVQNLSPVTNAKVKVYFLDRSGDVITTLVDWICPRGSQTFFLPTIAALGGNWVGSARVESQSWWAPGTNPVDYPKISSVVLLEKWSDPARTTRREAVAYNGQTECLLYDWQVGSGKGGTQSGSAVFAVPMLSKGNRGVNSELAITNLVAKPGFTDFAIFIYDQNGLLDFVCQKLHDRQVEYIDLATWGYVPPNFLGSAVVSATFWEHDVFDPSGNFARNLVGLGGVVVERIGARQGEPDIPGDESKAFEAVPVFDHFGPEGWLGEAPRCPGQPGWNP